MKIALLRNFIIATLLLISIYAIYNWRVGELNLPEFAAKDRDGATARKAQSQNINIGESFEKFEEEAIYSDLSWTQFRGANRDNIVKTAGELDFDFNKNAPKVLWRVPLGQGYASPAIYNGLVYVLDYDEQEGADMLRCFNFENGKELWRRWYKVSIKRNHGISRTVPAVADGVVVSFAPFGHLMALDAKTGDLLWSKDLVAEYGSVIPQWYAGQCPLIDNKTVVIAPSGKDVLLMGLDLHTGEVLWQTENTEALNMSHSSIMIAEIEGEKQYIYGALGGTVGVSASEAGKLLWINKDFKPNVFAPSPVYLGDAKFLLTAGYGAGGALLQIEKNGDTWSSTLLKKWKPKEAISSEQQSPIFLNNKIYSIMPKDAGMNNSRFICADAEANTLYTSGTDFKFGLGPYIFIDNTFLVLDDEGVLYSLKEEGNTVKVLSFAKILNGHDSWGPLAYADGKIIARDMDEMVCVGFAKKEDKDEN
ncbi:MAG: PQQ-binding-like beta-propeller repeat protein [Opitutales bacterium]